MLQKINEKTFEGQSIYVGIDAHLKDFKLSIMAENVFYKTFSSPPRAEVIVNYLHNNFPGARYFSAYEAGFSGFGLHRALTALGVNSIVVNAADIPTSDKERQQKEDRRDSRKIVQMLRAGQLTAVHVPSLKSQQDRGLLRTRERMVRDLTRNKNRVKALLYFEGIDCPPRSSSHWSLRFIKWLETLKFEHDSGKYSLNAYLDQVKGQRALLLKLDRQMRELSRTSHYKKSVEYLITIPGIGPLTAMKLLTELESMERFETFDQLASYVGFVPSTCSSGQRQMDTGITRRKNSPLRAALIESAWIAIRNDPAMLACYQKHCKRMSGHKAIVRVAKKLLNRVRHVLCAQEPYEKGVVQ